MAIANNDIELYEHNKDLYERALNVINTNTVRDILITETMGGGKSFVVMKLINTLKDRFPRVLYICPSMSIRDNLCSYNEFELIRSRVVFVTQNSFLNINNVTKYFDNYDLFVYDEAHHIGADKSGTAISLLKDLICRTKNKLFLGLTGTEFRDSDKIHTNNLFSTVIEGNELIDFIENGSMPKFDYVICTPDLDDKYVLKSLNKLGRVNIQSSYQYIESIIKENPNKRKWLIFFDSIKRCDNSISFIKKLFPNHKIMVVHSKADISDEWISDANNNDDVVIMSVDKLIEGVHLEGFTAGIIYRNIKSLRVFKQLLGRLNKFGQQESPLVIDCSLSAFRVWKTIASLDENYAISFSNGETHYGPQTERLYDVVNSKYIILNNLLYEIKNTPSLLSECKDKDVNYGSFISYRKQHQNASVDDYVLYTRNKISQVSLRKECKEKGINVNSFFKYRKNHPDISIDEYIEHRKNNINNLRSVSYVDECKEKGVNYGSFMGYKKYHKNVNVNDYINHLDSKSNSLISQCNSKGINYGSYMQYKSRYPDSTIDDYALYLLNKKNIKSLRRECKEKGVNVQSYYKYRQRHTSASVDEYIKYRNNKATTFVDECKEKGVDYNSFLDYRRNRNFRKDATVDNYIKHKNCKNIH